MKKVLLLFLFHILWMDVSAQQRAARSKFSLGAALAFPTGSTAETFERGYGGSVAGEYHLKGNLNLVASVGYMRLHYRTDAKARIETAGEEVTENAVIPLKVGARHYFGGIYYADLQTGAAFTTGEDAHTSLTYAPSLGAVIPISRFSGADIGLRYEHWTNQEKAIAFFGLRVAVTFAL